jgi:hypothetical protein
MASVREFPRTDFPAALSLRQRMEETMEWLNWVGLVLNFVGAVMIATSIGKPLVSSQQVDGTFFAVVVFPRVFRFGLGIVIAGFLVQLVAKFPG